MLTSEQLENKLKDAKALLGEFFPECMIVVPHGEGIWIAMTNRTWALGASYQTYEALKLEDELARTISSDQAGGGEEA